MPDLKKLPRNALIAGAVVATAGALFVFEDLRLRSNLQSTTRITQNMREELEALRRENDTFKQREQTEQSKFEDMSAQMVSLQQERSLSAGRQQEMKKAVETAEKTLDAQNRKIMDLESKLRDAEQKISRQKKASANLEQQTRSARANPGMTAEYVKLVESEWMAAVAKTNELDGDLKRTLSELSGQNKERTKLQNETATMHYNLAVILTEQQNFPAAVTEYRKVLEIRPSDADAHYNLAVIYDDYLKDNEKALEHYRQYIKAAPDTAEAQKVRQWIKDKEYDSAFKFKL